MVPPHASSGSTAGDGAARAHRFTTDIFTASGEFLDSLGIDLSGEAPAAPGVADLEPAREWLHYLALRDEIPLRTLARSPLQVEPVFEASDSAACRSVRVSLAAGDHVLSVELEPEYFRPAAEALAQTLVRDGKLENDARFLFHLCAFARSGGAAPRRDAHGDGGFTVEAEPVEPEVAASPLAPLLAASTPRGPHAEHDMPVFIPTRVLDELRALSRDADELESGALLAGRLGRCPDERRLHLEVTAAIPARHAEAATSSIALTPETFAAFDCAIALRAAGETAVGFHHSHPAHHWCRRCPPERQRVCAFSQPFFSREDKHVHRTAFPLAHQVALLVTNLGERGLVETLYGWREARIVERGFHELG